ncbi:MAG: hypothetical protein ACK4QP_04455 [Pseudorhizobium sp.]
MADARRKVNYAKVALGERGSAWWEDSERDLDSVSRGTALRP